jgi:hypothetical protein
MLQAILRFLSLTEFWVGALGLAAFLALFWVLRGAPVGQSVRAEDDDEAPRGGYRDRVVAAVTLGLMLILVGGYIAITRGPAWSIPAFLLGFGTVFSLVLINQRYRHGSPTLRRTVDVSTATLNASLFAGILIVVNVIAFRFGGRALDMTREHAYSLSARTINQVRSLQKPVTFTMFFGRSGVALQQRDRVEQLLEMYKNEHPSMVRIDSIDPYRDLTRYDALVKEVPAVDVTQGGGIVVAYGEGETADREVIRNTDLFEIPRAARFDPNADQFESSFTGEDALTYAMMRLREGKRQKIVFTTGHGEPSIDDLETSHPGLGQWKSRLTATGSDVLAVNLLTQEVPDDASLLVVAGPKNPFRPEEVTRLGVFVGRKKPVLVLASDVESTGLEEFFRGFQIELQRGFVIEPQFNVRGNRAAVLVPVVNQKHPILEPLNRELVYLPGAAPLKVMTAPANQPSVASTVSEVLLRTSPQSWAAPDAKTAREPKGIQSESGPLITALAVSDRPPPGDPKPTAPRMVVISCGYAGDNAVVAQFPTNLDLLMNAVGWLRGKPETLGIDPKKHVSLMLTADPVIRARLILVPTVMAMLLVITLGVTTYLARRD